MDKEIRFVGTSRDDLSIFPPAAKRRAGFELRAVQKGDEPSDFEPMPSVGAGVYEIRIRTEGQAHRVFYAAKFEEAVYVLHAFEKKSQKTSHKDIETGKRRYNEVVRMRRG